MATVVTVSTPMLCGDENNGEIERHAYHLSI